MSCILINAAAGGAVIDAIIPAAYSAVLLVGVTLYNVSLLALLLPFCITIGIICYIVFIHNPVLAAYSHRSPAPNQMDLDATIFTTTARRHLNKSVKIARGPNSSLRNIYRYVLRLLNRIIHAAEYFVTRFSYQGMRSGVARQADCEREWCHLNMPSISQGTISAIVGKVAVSKRSSKSVIVASRKKRDMFTLKSSRYNPPPQIMKMMIAGPTGRNTNCSLVDAISDLTGTETLCQPNECIVHVSKKITESSKKLKSLILFDARDALVRVRSQLFTGSSEPWDIIDHFDVSEFDLSSTFQNIFDSFYPDGIVMSQVEKTEAGELYNEWKSMQNFHFKLEIVGKRLKKRRMISFHLFEGWFMEDLMGAIHNIVSERLMAHTFKFRPVIRANNIYETSPHPFDMNHALNTQDEGRLNMKALEMVTAHSLSVSRRASFSRSSYVNNSFILISSNMNARSDTSTRFILEQQQDTSSGTSETSTSTSTPGCLGDIFCNPEYSL